MANYDRRSIEERLGPVDPHRPAVELSTGEKLTEGQLRDLKNDPRYWQAGNVDRDYQRWVDQLYETAYPTTTVRRVP